MFECNIYVSLCLDACICEHTCMRLHGNIYVCIGMIKESVEHVLY
jgi:hypothetical protein